MGNFSNKNENEKLAGEHSNDYQINDNQTNNDLNNTIKEHLEKQGVTISEVPEETEAHTTMAEIALYMGEKHELIQPVYKQIKKHLDASKTPNFNLKLADETQDCISCCCQFCDKLHKLAMLKQYTYLKSPRYEVYAAVNQTPEIINFMTGHWLELYASKIIEKMCNAAGIKYEIVCNSQVKLSNGDSWEIDVLLYVNKKIYWIEAKTGNYQLYITKYKNMRKTLNIDKENSILLLSAVDEEIANSLTNMHEIKVCTINMFKKFIENNILNSTK